MDPFDPLFTVADDDSTTATTTAIDSANQYLLDILGGGDDAAGGAPQLLPTSAPPGGTAPPSGVFDDDFCQDLCDLTGNTNQDTTDLTGNTNQDAIDLTGNTNQDAIDLTGNTNQDAIDLTGNTNQDTIDLTDNTNQDAVDLTGNTNQDSVDLIGSLDQDSGDLTGNKKHKSSCEVSGAGRETLSDVWDSQDGKVQRDPCDVTDEVSRESDERTGIATPTADSMLQGTEQRDGGLRGQHLAAFTQDSSGGISDGVVLVHDPLDGRLETSASPEQSLATPASHGQQNDPLLIQGDTTTAAGESTESGADRDGAVDLVDIMEPLGDTQGGTADAILDDFFGSAPSPSQPATKGVADATFRLNDSDGAPEQDGDSCKARLTREGSPQIVVDGVDGVENVTLKDATSEKALLGSGADDEGVPVSTDSFPSTATTHQDSRKSSSDIDLDFAVLELDSSHLNLDLSKQKTSLRKKGSLARRKKPSRGSVHNVLPDSPDSIYLDSTDSKPVQSPTIDSAEDDVFDNQAAPMTSEPLPEAAPTNRAGVRKAALPFKPTVIMPGLQDLSKSKLFSQERKKSGESPTSPVKSPIRVTSPLSPSGSAVPPLVLPKPSTKGQKDSQNMTIAAEQSSQDARFRSDGSGDVFNGSVVTAGVVEEAVLPQAGHAGAASSAEGSAKLTRTDSGSVATDRSPGRTGSWSSVSSPRRVSQGGSVSSLEGGEAGSASGVTPRRASIQGSAYTPIGFRPRRSSSIVLDSNNKLIDSPAPPSPSPSTTPATTTTPAPVTSSLEEEAEAPPPSVPKSPLYKPPVWLSEMKSKTANVTGDSSSLPVGSNETAEGSATPATSTRSSNSSESAGSADGGSAEGARGRSVSDEVNRTKGAPQTVGQGKPVWLKAAQEKTSRLADKLQTKTDGQEDGREGDGERPAPPWAAELKKKNRPLVVGMGIGARESNGKVSVTPFKNNSDKNNSPVVNADRDQYTPSWMKSSRQLKKTPLPPPGGSGKVVVTNGSQAGVKGVTENPMKAYETPKWKMELAEKKKRREAEMMTAAEGGGGSEGGVAASGTAGGTSSVSSHVPQWKNQLSMRSKQPASGTCKEADAEAGSSSSSGPDWAKQAEERRARLMRSGLLDKANTPTAAPSQ